MPELTEQILRRMFASDPVENEIRKRFGSVASNPWDTDTSKLPHMGTHELLGAAAVRIEGMRADLLEMHLEALADRDQWRKFSAMLMKAAE